MNPFMAAALEEAKAGFEAGGAPVGCVLVRHGEIVGRGRNRLFQDGDPTAHAELEAYRDAAARAAGRRAPEELDAYLQSAEVYTTMMPCAMCAGAIIHFAARRVVVGETTTYAPANTRPLLERQRIEVVVLEEPECIALVEAYQRRRSERRRIMRTPRMPPLRL